jgi:hypothetical protein
MTCEWKAIQNNENLVLSTALLRINSYCAVGLQLKTP